ncbi:Alpha/Beta hydrolase protein, partial [Lasiosphaeria ovina]
QPGADTPVRNTWSWHQLTNVVWVQQPMGTGFSTGNVTAKKEDDIAKRLMAFWKNFIDTPGIQGHKVYITSESYVLASPKKLLASRQVALCANVETAACTVLILPPTSSTPTTHNPQLLRRPRRARRPILSLPTSPSSSRPHSCRWTTRTAARAIFEINPTFNMCQLAQPPPMPYDPLGLESSMHAPLDAEWATCGGPVSADDNDNTSGSSVVRAISSVTDRTKSVIITHGAQYLVLLASGILLAIQNMTWGEMLGLQTAPRDPLFVPYHYAGYGPGRVAGAGVPGTERGLVRLLKVRNNAQIPLRQPAAAVRQVEFLLGHVKSLNSTQPPTIFPQQPSTRHERARSGHRNKRWSLARHFRMPVRVAEETQAETS